MAGLLSSGGTSPVAGGRGSGQPCPARRSGPTPGTGGGVQLALWPRSRRLESTLLYLAPGPTQKLARSRHLVNVGRTRLSPALGVPPLRWGCRRVTPGTCTEPCDRGSFSSNRADLVTLSGLGTPRGLVLPGPPLLCPQEEGAAAVLKAPTGHRDPLSGGETEARAHF